MNASVGFYAKEGITIEQQRKIAPIKTKAQAIEYVNCDGCVARPCNPPRGFGGEWFVIDNGDEQAYYDSKSELFELWIEGMCVVDNLPTPTY